MKAISPMIAVVLLIAFTIGIGTIVSIFATSLTTTSTGITGKSSENLTQCSLASLEIKEVKCSSTSNGLIIYWKFESVNSTNYTADISGNNHPGLLVNYSCSPATCNISKGKYNNGLDLNGVGNHVNLSMSIGSTDDLTISFWMRAGVQSDSGRLVTFGNSSTSGRGIEIAFSGGDMRIDNIVEPTGGIYGNSTWNHVAITKSGATFTLYMNGTSLGTGTGYLANNTDRLRISSRADTYPAQWYFNGSIDDFRFYNRSLSAGEVSDIFQDGSSLRVLISNNGPVNLGRNFTLVYISGGAVNVTYVNLTSDLTPGSTGRLTLQNITDSGALSQVRVTSTVCPTVIVKKDVAGQIC
ncbi:MAG: LamG domain-containing protein [Candidatus Aenigmarchaeota archaeon]|nr:LamG domain-containing protein [Candidatus Aenigmarchaeota archaeon]